MIPSRRLLVACAAFTLVGAGVALRPGLEPAWAIAGAAGGALVLLDALLCWRVRAPGVARNVPPAVSMQSTTRVEVCLRNEGRRALVCELFDHHPDAFETDDLPRAVRVPAGSEARAEVRLRPLRRGPARFGPVELRIASPLRLFQRTLRLPCETEVRVYPDFETVRRYQLLATEHRTSQLGVRRRPRRGAGLEFHQLREYRSGDPLRQIDWKATSRLRRAISREYQDERDQQVVLMLDCGRRMRARDGRRAHLDAALDAALLVGHVALRQGDAVGVGTLGGTERWLAPRKGPGQLNLLLDTVYDLEPQPRASDHLAAAGELLGRIRKRSLVVWVSNLRDEDGTELGAALRLLAKRHLVLLASLREGVLDEQLERPVRSFEDAARTAAIHHYQDARRRSHAALETGGALLLDVAPDQLPVALVNGYLDVKAAGML